MAKFFKLSTLLLIMVVGFVLFVLVHSLTLANKPDRSMRALAQKIFVRCMRNNQSDAKLGCYAIRFEEIAYSEGQNYAYEMLTQLQEIDKDSFDCHVIGHGIGWGIYRKNPTNWQDAISSSKPDCGYGEQMGIIERYAQTLPTGSLTQANIGLLCGDEPRGDCNHAVGHVILVLSNNDLDVALDLCKGLKNDSQHSMCISGVLMERLVGDNLRSHGLSQETGDNWYFSLMEDKEFCSNLKNDAQEACWAEITHPAYYYFKKDPVAVFRLCKEAPTAQAIIRCSTHALHIIAGGLQYDLDRLRGMCQEVTKDDASFANQCYSQVASLWLNKNGLSDFDNLVSYCMLIPEENRTACFTGIIATMKRLDLEASKIRNLCGSLTQPYRSICLRQIQ